MLNYNRRKRQAKENYKSVLDRFLRNLNEKKVLYQGCYVLSNETDVDKLLGEVILEVKKKASEIQPDWSIPIIIETIGNLYYGKEKKHIEFGTAYKRALAYLWKANFNNMPFKKNDSSLVEVLELCYVIENLYSVKRVFLFLNDSEVHCCDGYFEYDDKYCAIAKKLNRLNHGRGKRLRVADVTNKLMFESSKEFSEELENILDGKSPKKVDIFKGTFYEKIPGISNFECKKFWQELNFRYKLFMMMLIANVAKNINDEDAIMSSVNILPEVLVEVPEGHLTQDIVISAFWREDWLATQNDEVYSNLIVERPVLRLTLDGDFATSPALIGDSINMFVESQIMKYRDRSSKINLPESIFKETISTPFEDDVIEGFRNIGFEAGHITERGIWKNQYNDLNLNWSESEKLYGEIDCFAYKQDIGLAILIECKVLNDVRSQKSYKNLIAKINDDSEGFQEKILKKSKWLKSALLNYNGEDIDVVNVILTDISLPIVDFPNKEIIFSCYDRLFSAIYRLNDKSII